MIANIRLSLRALRNQSGFAAVVVLTLALGIGANTAVFSVLEAALLRDLPFRDPDRIVTLSERTPGMENRLVSPSSWAEWQQRARSFEELAAFMWWDNETFSAGDGPPETIVSTSATPGYFRIMGVAPMLGRTFDDAKGKNDRYEVVLSYSLWKRRFHGDPNVIGRPIRLSLFKRDHIVVGVMPAAYADFEVGWGEVWIPIYYEMAELRAKPAAARYVRVVGRLKPAVTLGQARAEMVAVQKQLARERPILAAGWQVVVESLRDTISGRAKATLFLAIGAVLLVLLTASINVANLLLARAAAREREWAVRAALGASRVHLFGQLLTDGLVFSFLGAMFGLPLAYGAVKVLVWMQPDIPRSSEIGVNMTVLVFTLAVTMLTAILSSLAPALSTARQDVQKALKEGGRGTASRRQQRLRSWLVASEVAFAVMLLVGTGLLLRSFANLLRVHPGFDAEKALIFDLSLPYMEEQRKSFCQRLFANLETLPQVEAVGRIRYFPYHARLWTAQVRPESQAVAIGQEPIVHSNMIAGNYIQAMGMPLLRGEIPATATKRGDVRPVLVNQSFARLLWGSEDPIGKVFRQDEFGRSVVVGLVGDVRQRSLAVPPHPEIYVIESREDFALGTFVVRTKVSPDQVIGAVRQVLRTLDPNLPVNNLVPLREFVGRTIASQRLALALFAVFGGLALSVAAIGLYGVISYLVARKTSEIGIRMAVGASPANVLQLITGHGLRLVAMGIVAGLAGSLIAGSAARTLLYGVAATDFFSFGAAVLVVFFVALVACVIPAARATRIDPMTALKQA